MIRFILRALRIAAMVVVASVLMFVLGVALYTRTQSFRDLALEQIVGAADAALVGDVSADTLEGSIWSHLSVHGLAVRHQGAELLHLQTLTVRYSLPSLVRGILEIGAIELDQLTVRATQSDSGSWDVGRALAPVESSQAAEQAAPADDTAGGLPIGIEVSSLRIAGGTITVTPFSEDPQTFTLNEVTLEGDLALHDEGLRAGVENLSATLTSGDRPAVDLLARITYDQRSDRTQIDIEQVRIASESSTVEAAGHISDLERQKLSATVELTLSDHEMRAWHAAWPLHAELSGRVAFDGDDGNVRADVDLAADEARLELDGTVDAGASEPTYDAELRYRDIVPRKLLALDDFRGSLHGRAHFSGTGRKTETLKADIQLDGNGLAYEDISIGDLTAALTIAQQNAVVRADLDAKGTASLRGEVHLLRETYDLTLITESLDVAGIATDAQAAPGSLSAEARIRGKGFAIDQADATAKVEVAASTIGPVDVESTRMLATLAAGNLAVKELDVRANGSRLVVSGAIRHLETADPAVELAVEVEIPTLAPWLRLADQRGTGTLQALAKLDGRLSALAVKGGIDLTRLEAGDVRTGSARIDADLTGMGSDAPTGSVRLNASTLNIGAELETLELSATLLPGDALRADITLDATTADDLEQSLRGQVTVEDARQTVDLRAISIALPTGTWTLAGPAKVTRGEQRIGVADLRLSSSDQRLIANGSLGPETTDALRLRIENISLESFAGFVGDSVEQLAGTLDADLTLRGPMVKLEPEGRVRLRDGRAKVLAAGVLLEDVQLDAALTRERIDLAQLSARAEEGTLEASGVVGLRDYQADEIDLTLRAKRWPAVDNRHYKALLEADITASGSLDAPQIVGNVSVPEANLRPDIELPGAGGPPPRDQTITVVQEEQERLRQERDSTSASNTSGESPETIEDASIDVRVSIGPNVWIKRDDTSLELLGDVQLMKKSGEQTPTLIGDVEIRRGWIFLYGRRFEPRTGVVRFTGGAEIDPTLNIELATRTTDYTVTTIISGTASEPDLRFESEPRLEEADILAVLMFGKPVSDLGDGEKVALEQQAAEFASGYLASKVGQQLGDAFGFQISELDVIGGRVGVGKYLTPKTYISVIQDITGRAAREIRVDYYFNKSWTARTQSDSEGESGADLFWRKKY